MSARVPCQTPGCPHTILPITAERTGGICMPCAQRIAAEEHERYVAAHRVDIDRFAGLTDPVEILLAMHHRLPYDELKNHLPYPRKAADLYRELGQSDADRLVGRADSDLLPDVAKHLAQFGRVDLTACQKRVLATGDAEPALVFRAASDAIVATLIKLVQHKGSASGGIDALAWAKTPRAVAALTTWTHAPHMRRLVGFAVQSAGYELVGGRIRDLVAPVAWCLVRSDAAASTATPTTATLFAPADHGPACPCCGQEAVFLLAIDTRTARDTQVPGLRSMPTCIRCASSAPIWVQFERGGRWSWLEPTPEPDDQPDWPVTPIVTPIHVSLRARPPWEAVDWCHADGISQLGGHASWIQDPFHPPCPRCDRSMPFVGQVGMEDFTDGEGVFAMNLCAPCGVGVVSYQQS
jgi:hypothetical protein